MTSMAYAPFDKEFPELHSVEMCGEKGYVEDARM